MLRERGKKGDVFFRGAIRRSARPASQKLTRRDADEDDNIFNVPHARGAQSLANAIYLRVNAISGIWWACANGITRGEIHAEETYCCGRGLRAIRVREL